MTKVLKKEESQELTIINTMGDNESSVIDLNHSQMNMISHNDTDNFDNDDHLDTDSAD